MAGTVVAQIIGDNSAEKQAKDYRENIKPTLQALIKSSGKALYVLINVACIPETSLSGGLIHLIGDHEGNGNEIFHEINLDLLESPAMSPNFGGAIIKYMATKKENVERKKKGLSLLPYETGIARSGGRVHIFDVFTEDEYTAYMKKKNIVQSFPMVAPAPLVSV